MFSRRVIAVGLTLGLVGVLVGGCLAGAGDKENAGTQPTTYVPPHDTKAGATQATTQLGWRRDEAGNLMVCARVRDGAIKEFKTRLLEDLKGFKTSDVELDQYGGWIGEKFDATGFFHARKIGERWWLIDPVGYRYINIAVNAVNPGSGPQMKKAFKARFATPEQWWDETLTLLCDNGFNGTGAWSEDKLNEARPRKIPGAGPRRIPYTPTPYFAGDYARKIGWTVPEGGHIGFKNKCLPIFDDAFVTFCDQRAKGFAANKNDPWLLGYFSDNELPFPNDSLDRFLALGEENAGGRAARKFLADRKKAGDEKITDADRDDWQSFLVDKYYSTVSKAIRKYDPNHMYLGSRFWSDEHWKPGVWAAAGKYLDVVSVNVYSLWDAGWVTELKWTQWAGRPMIATEWYAKGADTGMANMTGSGWTVATQQERGWFYQNFTLSLLEHRGCVGWHWFMYLDNDPTDANAEKSNRDSNKGIVNVRYEPYVELLRSMKAVNTQAYPLAKWFEEQRAGRK